MNRRLAALAVLACVLSTPAFGHARLLEQSPKADATLSVPPREVRLMFSDYLEPEECRVAVSDAKGRSVAAAPPAIARDLVVVKLKSLPPGRYRVEWHAVSEDWHRTRGAYEFTVKK